jgi:hypothetical protein
MSRENNNLVEKFETQNLKFNENLSQGIQSETTKLSRMTGRMIFETTTERWQAISSLRILL